MTTLTQPENTLKRPCRSRELGAIAVEYGLCMLLAAALMVGVQEMFWDMAVSILDSFMEFIAQPHP